MSNEIDEGLVIHIDPMNFSLLSLSLSHTNIIDQFESTFLFIDRKRKKKGPVNNILSYKTKVSGILHASIVCIFVYI